MFTIFLTLLVSLFLWMTLWYAIAMYFRRTDIVDMVWWLSYGVIAIVLFFFAEKNAYTMIACAFVVLWSLRLVSHIVARLKHHDEDSRYAAFRVQWGKQFWWKSYLYIFLLQWLFIAIISIPMIFIFTSSNIGWVVFFLWAFFWIVWFLCEFFSDRQMNEFRHKPDNKGKIIQTGLWKYSRHPNYFWEILMWWSVWIMSISSTQSLIGILSPLLLSYLIIYVTGIPLLEKALQKREWYKNYVEKTSILIPFPPKK